MIPGCRQPTANGAANGAAANGATHRIKCAHRHVLPQWVAPVAAVGGTGGGAPVAGTGGEDGMGGSPGFALMRGSSEAGGA